MDILENMQIFQQRKAIYIHKYVLYYQPPVAKSHKPRTQQVPSKQQILFKDVFRFPFIGLLGTPNSFPYQTF